MTVRLVVTGVGADGVSRIERDAGASPRRRSRRSVEWV